MISITFELGHEEELKALYSISLNSNKSTLISTIEHWFFQTLTRDGYTLQPGAKNSVKATVVTNKDSYLLTLEGPDSIEKYEQHLTHFLDIGREALHTTAKIKTQHKVWPKGLKPQASNCLWDPQQTGQWRFFMPLGMAMLNHKVINFFHYPSIRLLSRI